MTTLYRLTKNLISLKKVQHIYIVEMIQILKYLHLESWNLRTLLKPNLVDSDAVQDYEADSNAPNC